MVDREGHNSPDVSSIYKVVCVWDRGVGRWGGGGGRRGRTTPPFWGKLYTFPIKSVRAEISAQITLLKINI